MTRDEYLAFHQHCLAKMTDITTRKNADYANSADPFANFSRVEVMGVTTVEKGFLVRILDKFSRLVTFADKGRFEVLDESVEDTLLDCANYCILMAAYIKSKETNK